VRVPAEDTEERKKLSSYMLRAPMSLEKMTYDAATGTVIYRSKMPLGLKRNFQVAECGVAGAAVQTHSRPLRASGALLWLVFHPRAANGPRH